MKITNEDTLEALAMQEYRAALGTVVEAGLVFCRNEQEDIADVVCDPPAKVRVVNTPEDGILHWNEEWLDPYWDVELAEPHPALKGLVALWIDGPSHEGIKAETAR